MLGEIKRTLRSIGFTAHPIKTRAFYIKGYRLQPDVVFDVGVFAGTPWLYKAFPAARFVLIDPQEECADKVRKTGLLPEFDYHAVALGAETRTATLNVPETEPGKGGAMASLLERTGSLAETFTGVEKRSVPVQRLDEIAQAYPGRVGLKIDTEGFETEVLLGATETLNRCDFVILELSLDARRFEGTPPPSSAITPLTEAGLELRDILTIADGPGKRAQPRYVDALFTRWAA